MRTVIIIGLSTTFCYGNGVLRWGFGADDLGAAGAFGLTHGSAITAVQGNPAMLTHLENEITISGRLLLADAKFDRGGIRERLSDDIGAFPDLALSWQSPHPAFTFGFGISPVSALEAKWRYADLPGGIGGISFGDVPHESRYVAVRLAAGLGYRVNESLSLGITAGMIRSEVHFDAPFIFQTNPALAGAKVNLDLETDDWAPSFVFGATYRPHPDWMVGLQVTPPVSFDHRGRADADFSAQLPPLGLAGTDPLAKYDARARNELPLTIGLGTSWDVTEKLSLGLRADWHQWSKAYDQLRINLSNGSNAAINGAIGSAPSDKVPVRWRDRIVIALGAQYEITPEWTIRGGWRYGKSPIPDEFVTPLNGAILEQAVTLGLGWHRGDWHVDAAWAYEFGSSVSVGTSAYNAGEYSNSSLDLEVNHFSLSVRKSF